jgi:hypothetical protein
LLRDILFRKELWGVFFSESSTCLCIAGKIYSLGDVTLTARSGFFVVALYVQCGDVIDKFYFYQPWIKKPWILLDFVTYDDLDYELDCFPVFLAVNAQDPKWIRSALTLYNECSEKKDGRG